MELTKIIYLAFCIFVLAFLALLGIGFLSKWIRKPTLVLKSEPVRNNHFVSVVKRRKTRTKTGAHSMRVVRSLHKHKHRRRMIVLNKDNNQINQHKRNNLGNDIWEHYHNGNKK